MGRLLTITTLNHIAYGSLETKLARDRRAGEQSGARTSRNGGSRLDPCDAEPVVAFGLVRRRAGAIDLRFHST
jgi:hypothetical protein